MSDDSPAKAPHAFDLWRQATSDSDRDDGRQPPLPGADGAAPAPTTATVEDPAINPDDGALPHEARRALVYLLKHGIILFDQKRLLFEALSRHRHGIEQHLANMYLRLLLDDRAGVALLLQQESDDDDDADDAVTLIHHRTLTLYETLLLLVLRKHYQERETSGERKVVIDVDHIEARMTPFLPLTNNSRLERGKLVGSLNKLVERKILSAVRGDEERYEITPAIRYLVSAEFLRQLLAEYHKLASMAQGGEDMDDE